jgi:hypothetical protein
MFPAKVVNVLDYKVKTTGRQKTHLTISYINLTYKRKKENCQS